MQRKSFFFIKIVAISFVSVFLVLSMAKGDFGKKPSVSRFLSPDIAFAQPSGQAGAARGGGEPLGWQFNIGGRVTAVTQCECSGGVSFVVVGPKPGAFFASYGPVYANAFTASTIHPNMIVAGSYIPGGDCQALQNGYCIVPYAQTGTVKPGGFVIPLLGTSI